MSDVNDKNIDEYLRTIHTECKYILSILFFIQYYISFVCKDPSSDDEISLQTLLNYQLNTELALAKFRQLPNKTICKNSFLSFSLFSF